MNGLSSAPRTGETVNRALTGGPRLTGADQSENRGAPSSSSSVRPDATSSEASASTRMLASVAAAMLLLIRFMVSSYCFSSVGNDLLALPHAHPHVLESREHSDSR